jgi:hypothetical protein
MPNRKLNQSSHKSHAANVSGSNDSESYKWKEEVWKTVKISQSQSYFMTDGRSVSQSVSMSWYRAPLWHLRPDITSCRHIAVWKLQSCFCAAHSLTRRRVCSFQIASAAFLKVKVEVTLWLTVSQSVSQSVCLGVEPTLGLLSRYYFLSECCCLKAVVVSVGSPLWREVESAVGNAITQWSRSHRTHNHTYCLCKARVQQWMRNEQWKLKCFIKTKESL